jgi:hypothetical protein
MLAVQSCSHSPVFAEEAVAASKAKDAVTKPSGSSAIITYPTKKSTDKVGSISDLKTPLQDGFYVNDLQIEISKFEVIEREESCQAEEGYG